MAKLEKVEFIVIHHSLTEDGITVNWKAICEYHTKELGYDPPCGYHYGLERIYDSWAILTGRNEDRVGAHTKQQRMNYRSLGICVVGNYDEEYLPDEGFVLLAGLCTGLCHKYNLSADKIVPHNKYANYKTCPGRLFPMNELRQEVAHRLKR